MLPAALEGGEAGGEMGSVLGFCPIHMALPLGAASHEHPAPLQKGLKHPPSSVLPCSWEKQQLKLFCEKSFPPSPSMKTPVAELQASAWAGHKGLQGFKRSLASVAEDSPSQSVVAEANQLPSVVQGLNTSDHTPDVH